MRIFRIVALSLVVLVIAAVGIFYTYYKVTQKTIVVLLYDQFNLLDVVGSYQTASGLMLENYSIEFVAKQKGRVKSSYLQSLEADHDLKEIEKADILILPGVENPQSILEDTQIMEWIKKIDNKSDQTLSLGSGTVVLASTGVLKNKKATAPWYDQKALEQYGATYTNENYVRDGKYYSGMGASASIDMVLALINDIAGDKLSKTTQLFIAYDPQTPVHSGFFNKADSSVQRLAVELKDHKSIRSGKKKTIAMYLYKGFTMLDVSGPYQVFRELEPFGYQMKFVAKEKGMVKSDFIQSLETPYSISEIDSASLLFVPGGSTTYKILNDTLLVDWVKYIDKTTAYTTSVCSGSVLLGEAQLLRGKRATSHWYLGPKLGEFGITYSNERYTKDGKYITGAGVSSGIDLALFIVKQLEGEEIAKAIQLKIGYFPHPPFDAGTPEKSEKETVDMISKMFVGYTDRNGNKGNGKKNSSQAAAMWIDPVCHMDVTNDSDSVVYNGKVYHFCSSMCKKMFEKKPRAYLK